MHPKRAAEPHIHAAPLSSTRSRQAQDIISSGLPIPNARIFARGICACVNRDYRFSLLAFLLVAHMPVLSVYVPDAQRQHAHDSEPDDGAAHYEVTELQRVCVHI